jgi:uncharacterized delta-60 repeat protein
VIRVLFGAALALQCAVFAVVEAFAASATTYADLSVTGRTTLADPSETVRFYVEGSGCRDPSIDSPPTINGTMIEFSLGFSGICFATPPGFLWTSDLSSIPPGTYTVKYYRTQFNSTPPPGPGVLTSTHTLVVASRPSVTPNARAGTADPSFGNGGVVDIPFPGFFSAPLRLAIQHNGQVLASSEVSTNYAVSRLLGSGAVDGAFAVGGTIGFPNTSGQVRAMAVGVNDEILLAGGKYNSANTQIELAIQRYSVLGILTNELTFSRTALSSAVPIGINPSGLDIVTLPDGGFAVAGLSGNSVLYPFCTGRWFAARFTAGGTLDATFGQNGVYLAPSAGCVFRLVPTHDGGLLALGTDSDAVDANFLVKLNAQGQPDSTFGQGGIVTGTFVRSAPRVQVDDKIVLGGTNFSLLRLQSNGGPDLSFGNQGVLSNQTGMPLQLEDFLLTPDNTTLLVGALVVGAGAPGDPNVLITQPVLVRYRADGTLDTSFGGGGTSTIGNLSHSPPSGATGPAEMMTLMALPNGKALLAAPSASNGWYNRSMFLYRFYTVSAPSPLKSYQGLWWNAPAGSESGWGLNLAHQGDVIFATWFTYDLTGKAWWLAMTAAKVAENTYSGTLFQTSGPAFDAVPFPPLGSPGGAIGSSVGSATLAFNDLNNGTFAYTVNGISQTKAITRQVFGVLPDCIFEPQFDAERAANLTDLWWAAPSGSEAGWGLNITEQTSSTGHPTLFGTWFTYDHDRTPMWLSVTATFDTSSGKFRGDLYRTHGPPFNSVPFPSLGSPGGVTGSVVGSASFIKNDGGTNTFTYTLNGITQTKSITRQVFGAPRAVCAYPID